MASSMRADAPLPSREVHGNPRQSAVLALLHEVTQGPALIFTLRPTTLTHHAGQISFPGGGFEPGDENLATTALRETEEELGISTHEVEILGKISPLYIAPSQNLVHPYVGWLAELPTFDPNPVEVAGVLSIPLTHLLDPDTLGIHYWRRNGQQLTAPCFLINGQDVIKYPQHQELWRNACIWGATAMMLNELLQIVKSFI